MGRNLKQTATKVATLRQKTRNALCSQFVWVVMATAFAIFLIAKGKASATEFQSARNFSLPFNDLFSPVDHRSMGYPYLIAANSKGKASKIELAPKSENWAITPQLGHSRNVNSVTYSPDGRLLASGSGDETVKIWDAVTGQLVRTLTGHSDQVISITFSPNGRIIASGIMNGSIILWDAATGKLLHTLEGHLSSVTSVAFSKDGRFLATGGMDSMVHLWDVATGQLERTLSGHYFLVEAVAFSPDGRLLASGSHDSTIKLWDFGTGQVVRTLKGHKKSVKSIAFSPDGRFLASASDDKTINLWESNTGQMLRTLKGHSSGVSSVAFSPDGRSLASGSQDNTVRLWNFETGNRVRVFWQHSGGVNSVAFSPDGRFLVSGSGRYYGDRKDSKVSHWNVTTGKLVRVFAEISNAVHSDLVNSVTYSGDGRLLASGSSHGKVILWDVVTGKLARSLKGRLRSVNSVAFSPDGLMLASGSSERKVNHWDVVTGKLDGSLKGHSSSVNSVAISPDGRLLASGSWDKTIILWNLVPGPLVRKLKGHKAAVRSVAFSPDGRLLASGGGGYFESSKVRIWDAATGKLERTLKGHIYAISSVAFSPDGRVLASGSYDRGIKLWDMATGQLMHSLRGHSDAVYSVAFSPDGGIIASGSSDNTIKLWNAKTGKLKYTLEKHSSTVKSVSFSPDGRQLITGSLDGTIRVWRASDGKELASLVSFNDGEWVVVTPEGFFNASPGGAKHLNVVRGLKVFSIDQAYQALYNPYLVGEALVGDPDGKVAAAAAKLDLNKVIASGLSPQVRIVSPVSLKLGDAKLAPVAAADEIVEVEIELEDNGGGIGRVEWRVNGTTQGEVADRGFERIAPKVDENNNDDAVADNPRTIRLKQKLYLSSGNNEISVVAYNHANLIASEPISFSLTLEAKKIANPKLYVLAVGVDDYYDSRLKLNYAVSDVNSIGAAFTKAGSDLYDEVIVKTVLDKQVTKEGLDAAFHDLSKQIRPGDVFVFFIAGHGKTLDGRYYFLPRDFRYAGEESIRTSGIGQSVWQSWFARLKAQKSVLLYDTCESGTLTGDQTLRGLENVAAIDRLTRATGRTTLTAATDTAPALEGYRGHGLFTYAILDALANSDGDNDQQIEVTELATYIDKYLPQVSEAAFGYRQIPQMSIRGNSFPLVRPTNVLAGEGQPDKQQLKISKVPTHVVIKGTGLYKTAGRTEPTIRQLTPGTQLKLIELKNGWALVARDGVKMGFVAEDALVGLQ